MLRPWIYDLLALAALTAYQFTPGSTERGHVILLAVFLVFVVQGAAARIIRHIDAQKAGA